MKKLGFIYKEQLIIIEKLFFLNCVAFLNFDFPPSTNSKGLDFLYIYLDGNLHRCLTLIITLLWTSVFARENNLIQTLLCGLMGAVRICCNSIGNLALLGMLSSSQMYKSNMMLSEQKSNRFRSSETNRNLESIN